MPNELVKSIMKNIVKDVYDCNLKDKDNEKSNNITYKEELLLKELMKKSNTCMKESDSDRIKKVITLDELRLKVKG